MLITPMGMASDLNMERSSPYQTELYPLARAIEINTSVAPFLDFFVVG